MPKRSSSFKTPRNVRPRRNWQITPTSIGAGIAAASAAYQTGRQLYDQYSPTLQHLRRMGQRAYGSTSSSTQTQHPLPVSTSTRTQTKNKFGSSGVTRGSSRSGGFVKRGVRVNTKSKRATISRYGVYQVNEYVGTITGEQVVAVGHAVPVNMALRALYYSMVKAMIIKMGISVPAVEDGALSLDAGTLTLVYRTSPTATPNSVISKN